MYRSFSCFLLVEPPIAAPGSLAKLHGIEDRVLGRQGILPRSRLCNNSQANKTNPSCCQDSVPTGRRRKSCTLLHAALVLDKWPVLYTSSSARRANRLSHEVSEVQRSARSQDDIDGPQFACSPSSLQVLSQATIVRRLVNSELLGYRAHSSSQHFVFQAFAPSCKAWTLRIVCNCASASASAESLQPHLLDSLASSCQCPGSFLM